MPISQRTTRAQGQQWLGDVPSDKAFYCCNGEVYRNLRELEAGLARMADGYFVYHVNPEKNDFSKWVQDVVGDLDLARRLAACPTRAETVAIVSKRLGALRWSLILSVRHVPRSTPRQRRTPASGDGAAPPPGEPSQREQVA